MRGQIMMDQQATYDSLRTRWSLLSRLKDWGDNESWRVFFDTYSGLIFNVARKAGLTEAEADEVVQETLITVAKKMPEFKTNANAGSFKGWLLNTTRWKITDQYPQEKAAPAKGPGPRSRRSVNRGNGHHRTRARPRRPGSGSHLGCGVARESLQPGPIKGYRTTPGAKHYQIFHLNVIEDTPAKDVARRIGVNVAQVYLIKHRLSGILKKEVLRLQRELEEQTLPQTD